MATKLTPCPCGGTDYARCCGIYHNGTTAPDAERLMRSRYSAYVLKNEQYLLATWHPDTRPAALDLQRDPSKWLGLEIKKYSISDDAHATVEFVARYKLGGRAHRLHEISQFVLANGQWLYMDGEFQQ